MVLEGDALSTKRSRLTLFTLLYGFIVYGVGFLGCNLGAYFFLGHFQRQLLYQMTTEPKLPPSLNLADRFRHLTQSFLAKNNNEEKNAAVNSSVLASTHVLSSELFAQQYWVQHTYASGLQIPGILLVNDASLPTILHFHGNGCNAKGELRRAVNWRRNFPCNVYLAEYRGYGQSGCVEGQQTCPENYPFQVGLIKDAMVALNFLVAKGFKSIFVHGHSLGGAIAIHVLGQSSNPRSVIKGLIVDSSFVSVKSVIGSWCPLAVPLMSIFPKECSLMIHGTITTI